MCYMWMLCLCPDTSVDPLDKTLTPLREEQEEQEEQELENREADASAAADGTDALVESELTQDGSSDPSVEEINALVSENSSVNAAKVPDLNATVTSEIAENAASNSGFPCIQITIGAFPASANVLPTCYFIKHTKKELANPPSFAAAEATLSKYVEYGNFSNDSLRMLDQLLSKMFKPLLGVATKVAEATRSGSLDCSPSDFDISCSLTDDFMASLDKFSAHLKRTLQHVEGQVALEVPDQLRAWITRCTPATSADTVALAKLIEHIESWTTTIGSMLQEISIQTPKGPDPQAEIEFWVERNTLLTAISEQLGDRDVSAAVEILRTLNSPELEAFDFNVAQLTRQRAEAKDNVRFLSTLERHFKQITQCATFRQAAEHLPTLFNALRMVWVISRHFNTDERMVGLLERVAWLLRNKVIRQVSPKTLLKSSLEDAMQLCADAKHLLESWENSYLATRETIEQHGRDARWEFDRVRMFKHTTYMSHILQDLHDIARITQEFYNIFGQELKAVTGNPEVLIKLIYLNSFGIDDRRNRRARCQPR